MRRMTGAQPSANCVRPCSTAGQGVASPGAFTQPAASLVVPGTLLAKAVLTRKLLLLLLPRLSAAAAAAASVASAPLPVSWHMQLYLERIHNQHSDIIRLSDLATRGFGSQCSSVAPWRPLHLQSMGDTLPSFAEHAAVQKRQNSTMRP